MDSFVFFRILWTYIIIVRKYEHATVHKRNNKKKKKTYFFMRRIVIQSFIRLKTMVNFFLIQRDVSICSFSEWRSALSVTLPIEAPDIVAYDQNFVTRYFIGWSRIHVWFTLRHFLSHFPGNAALLNRLSGVNKQ